MPEIDNADGAGLATEQAEKRAVRLLRGVGKIIAGLLDAASAMPGHRPPELFRRVRPGELPVPRALSFCQRSPGLGGRCHGVLA